MKYCGSIFSYQRRKTRVVNVGDLAVGGNHPIRVQSMTIADTMDTMASVNEIIQLVDAGCEIVRLTAPSMNEAENLKNIKAELKKRGVNVPLVADIHFTPNAALVAADYVEKVRINPGNYADKKRFEQRDYTDEEYEAELERIEEKFKPLVLKCKALGRAMRIGTNHGSLSDRIMNRYGDTAEGMVESALEFVRICEKYDYYDLILSMKSSNPQVAIQAYRLLAARMDELRMDYPFHLGVTEAGDGEEGRIKSAVGIGALLEDGIGDTIRVSLTEDSVAEVPVALKLVGKYNNQDFQTSQKGFSPKREVRIPNPFQFERRKTLSSTQTYYNLSSNDLPRVELSLNHDFSDLNGALKKMARMLGKSESLMIVGNQNGKKDFLCETMHLMIQSNGDLEKFLELKRNAHQANLWVPFALDFNSVPELAKSISKSADRLVFSPAPSVQPTSLLEIARAAKMFGRPIEWKIDPIDYNAIEKSINSVLQTCNKVDYWNIIFSLAAPNDKCNLVGSYRYLACRLDAIGANFPILLRYSSEADFNSAILRGSSELGSLLCDGIGDALHIDANLPLKTLLSWSYNILQASRIRISKTDYISCPSCGRTLFNLQTTTERIKSKTDHLKGVKIAIMGCIVNGPGEMADADFGYVGAGPKKINLFVGKECVERNIPEEQADQRLIELIKAHGMWQEP